MNVSGVGATPPQPPPPPVAPAQAATSPAASDARGGGDPRANRPGRNADRAHEPHPAERAEAPPLRMLTVTEMRIMLGQLPVSAGLKAEHRPTDPTTAA